MALVALGALGGLFAVRSVSTAHSVLAVRQSVPRGQVITANDVMSVSIGVDPALQSLPAEQLGSVVGQTAAVDMPAGSLVTPADLTSAAVPSRGNSLVGISLTSGMLPAGVLRVGDPVRIILTPGQGASPQASTATPVAATVQGLTTTAGATNPTTVVNVQVPAAQAAQVAAWASTGKAAIVLDSSGR